MRKSRAFGLLALAVVAVTLLAGSASADPNPNSGRVPVTQPPDDVITDVCPFPIFIETLANNEYSRTHKNGVDIITGRLVVRITNTETGESRVYNISGPVHITRDGPIETDVFGGRSLLLDPSFGVLVTSGRVVGTFNTETGEFRIVSQRGRGPGIGQEQLAPALGRAAVRRSLGWSCTNRPGRRQPCC